LGDQPLPSLLIRHLDPNLHSQLKQKARANHRSLEEEARERLHRTLVQDACAPAQPETLYDIARRIFGEKNGFEITLPPRGSIPGRPPLDFSGPEYDP